MSSGCMDDTVSAVTMDGGTVSAVSDALDSSFTPQRPCPSFVDLYNQYLAAFNEHDLEKTLSFLSPALTVCIDGQVKKPSRERLESAYSEHWSRLTRPVTMHGEPEEFDDGLRVVLDDVDAGLRITVRYHYAEEGGTWLHIRHDIGERVPLKLDES